VGRERRSRRVEGHASVNWRGGGGTWLGRSLSMGWSAGLC
jgi:hypothetical protein